MQREATQRTFHAYVFIVIDCIEICRILLKTKSVVRARRPVRTAAASVLFRTVLLFLPRKFSTPYPPVPPAHFPSTTTMFLVSYSFQCTTSCSKIREIYRTIHTPAMAYNKIRHRLQQQQHSYRNARTRLMFFLVFLVVSWSPAIHTREIQSTGSITSRYI